MTSIRISLFSFIFVIVLTSYATACYAAPVLFGATGLDTEFCKVKTFRQTVVYIDDMMMMDNKTDWAHKISSKLKSTLMPGEHVTVVRLSPSTGQSAEVWSGCWPNFALEEQEKISKKFYFFSQNPVEGLQQQQAFFIRDFGAALTAIYSTAKRPEADVQINSKTPPQKQILRALSSDEGRFSNSGTLIRAVLYSDMLENSDLGSVFKPLPSSFPNYAEKLGSRFRHGVFYTFGAGEDLAAGETLPEAAKPFWTYTFKNMSAVMDGFGSDLNVANSIPIKNYAYDLHYAFDGQDLDGKMVLLVDDDDNLVDSWIGFSRLTLAGLKGSFQCKDENCKLDGTTTSSIATTNSPTETLSLSGRPAHLNGRLGVAGTKLMYDLKAELSNNDN